VSTGKSTSPKVIDLESLCRGFTEQNVRRLGGYACSPEVPDAIAIEAIKVLLAYGHGKPKSQKEISGPDGGPINLVIRNLIEEARQQANKDKDESNK
jgi:hypothetical protein